MQISSAKGMLDEIQSGLDKLSTDEKLKYVKDLNAKLKTINGDLRSLAELVQKGSKGDDNS